MTCMTGWRNCHKQNLPLLSSWSLFHQFRTRRKPFKRRDDNIANSGEESMAFRLKMLAPLNATQSTACLRWLDKGGNGQPASITVVYLPRAKWRFPPSCCQSTDLLCSTCNCNFQLSNSPSGISPRLEFAKKKFCLKRDNLSQCNSPSLKFWFIDNEGENRLGANISLNTVWQIQSWMLWYLYIA